MPPSSLPLPPRGGEEVCEHDARRRRSPGSIRDRRAVGRGRDVPPSPGGRGLGGGALMPAPRRTIISFVRCPPHPSLAPRGGERRFANMTLAAGARLGPYEIVAPLGAGGMGEVYKAQDTRLERTVAIKVLPQHLSSSAEVRQRFEREAKTISQLSHPHICALYDVGNQDGVEYLVMEYLEGDTLAQRLARGALPLDQTLRYGIEIADALDKAHRQGTVHRDLKPGNVMLTKSGVKLLDFGLAKVLLASPGG